MARAIWKGVISFGMVVIPVKMYTATESKTPSFNLLHRKCLSKIRQVRHCPVCDEYLGSEDTVRGYEYAKGQYVVLEESDFQKVPVKTIHTIDISGFVEAHEIDPLYYRGSYYLEPEELGAKPFFLLREALLATHQMAIAKVTFQGREHLCCLRPLDETLMLHTMYYHNEIRPPSDLVLPRRQAEIAPEELKMATTLVNAMAKRFRPEEYEDEYRLALERVIEAKIQGEEVKAPAAPVGKVADLMSALRASIEAAKRESAREEARTEEAARRRPRQHG
ncbi:MAG TPA: Ku protein [Dehalococcoidia bacterium]|nr:Ku protein [Dehalococcoidia bacterium]